MQAAKYMLSKINLGWDDTLQINFITIVLSLEIVIFAIYCSDLQEATYLVVSLKRQRAIFHNCL